MVAEWKSWFEIYLNRVQEDLSTQGMCVCMHNDSLCLSLCVFLDFLYDARMMLPACLLGWRSSCLSFYTHVTKMFRTSLTSYIDTAASYDAVVKEMNAVNPKYVLRNWMAVMAYDQVSQAVQTSTSSSSSRTPNYSEKLQDNHTSILNELQSVLETPYEEQPEDVQRKWYRKTPSWAQSK